MKKLSLLAVTLLSGCASTAPKVHWFAYHTLDEFTDEQRCKVTVGSRYTENSIYTETGKLYPYIEQVDGQLRVGVRSGGKYPVPVGNVQLRIDKNKAWDILTSETPIDQSLEMMSMDSYYKSLPEDQQKIVKASIDNTKKITSQALQPFTAATDEKAQKILNEMLNGKVLIYRSKYLTYQKSSTGEYVLDESLLSALQECSISY